MTDFLTRLAQTIHGLQTQIQPLIASRYAPGPELSPLNETGASEENFNQARPAVPQTEEAAGHTARPIRATSSTDASLPGSDSELKREAETVDTARSAFRTHRDDQSSFLVSAQTQPEMLEAMNPAPHGLPVTSSRAEKDESEASKRAGPGLYPAFGPTVDSSEIFINEEAPPFAHMAGDRPSGSPALKIFGQRDSHDKRKRHEAVMRPLKEEIATDRQPAESQQHSQAAAFLRPERMTHSDSPASELAPSLNPPAVVEESAHSSLRWNAEAAISGTQASQREPVIHITIGRVEVRAVTRPAPGVPEPLSPPAPRMSLDDYLRLHNGRRG
jgi:hypothetical protein